MALYRRKWMELGLAVPRTPQFRPKLPPPNPRMTHLSANGQFLPIPSGTPRIRMVGQNRTQFGGQLGRNFGTLAGISISDPITICESVLRTIHDMPLIEGGVPYWAAIVGLTVFLRTFVTLPIALSQRARQKRYKELEPMIRTWEQTYRNQISLEGTTNSGSFEAYERRLRQLVRSPSVGADWSWRSLIASFSDEGQSPRAVRNL